MKDVQQVGGPYDEQSQFIGLIRQITVDTTNWRLLLHDGVTPGGHEFLSLNELNVLFQGTNAELTGFGNIDNLAYGLLARTGPGTYTTRSLAFSDDFVVTNGSGRNGNPTVELKPLIASDLTFGGAIHFTGTVHSDGPWTGPTNGTHTGPVAGDVTGNVTGALQGNSEGNHVGGLDARGAELFFDAGQIPAAAIAGLVAALASIPNALPTGVILIWSGLKVNIPAGYHFCDGTNGTPDLQDKFVICSGNDSDPHGTGGNFSYTPGGILAAAGDHQHGITVDDHALTILEIPGHTHSVACGTSEGDTATNFTNGNNSAGPAVVTSSAGGGQAHSHPGSSDLAGNHTHVFTGTAAQIVPVYYSLCYIMKL